MHFERFLKGYHMNKYVQRSRGTQVTPAPKPIRETQHPGPAPTHSEIAQRAYEIYVESGYEEGQSVQNWLQAEQELANRRHWRQADRDVKERSMTMSAS